MTAKNLILTALLVLSLAACTLAGRPTPPPTSVDLSGAAGLYLQASSGARSARSILAPDGATLMKLLTSGAVGEATFEDSEGAQVTVSVTRTLQLSADYLLAELDYGETPLVALVTLATGELRALPVNPDNWDRMRMAGNTAYYVSGGAIHRVDLDTLAAVDMSQGDRISGNSLVFLDANSDVHTIYLLNGSIDPSNQIRTYYADGSPFDALGWGSPDAYLLYENHLEDQATGELWRVTAGASGLVAVHYNLTDSGVSMDPQVVLDASLGGAHAVLGPTTGKRFLGDVAFSDGDNIAVPTIVAGEITGVTKRALHTYDQPTVYLDGVVYTASATGVDVLDVAAGTIEQPITDTGILALEVVADQIFYSKSDGVRKYDPATDETELVSPDPAEISRLRANARPGQPGLF